ncbi:MAG: hypothetical protein HFF14_04550 [Angelakisella sp.]|jgi:hypothetical protein|nr:hypothetical protein [Angelakisella sp.]
MRLYQMDHGWYFSVPDNWTAERDSQDGHYLFYPPDSDLTLHFTPWQVEREGEPAPAELMIGAFLRGMPEDAKPMDKLACHLNRFDVKGFAFSRKRKGQRVFQRMVGYYAPGALMSVGIFGTWEQECDRAVTMLDQLQRA